MKFKKTIAKVLTLAMMISACAMTSFADGDVPSKDGNYIAEVHMYQNNYAHDTDKYSMCAGLFSAYADVEISGDYADLTLYVANPIPMFVDLSNAATDGVLKDFYYSTTANEVLAGTADESKKGTVICYSNEDDRPSKYFDKSSMGTEVGNYYPCDIVEITVPTSLLSDSYIDLTAYVNVVMLSQQDFDLVLENYTEVATDDDTDSDLDANVTTTYSMNITATVEKNISSFSVTIPETTNLGDLSTTNDTEISYDISVAIGADGKSVTVETTSGELVSTENVLNVENTFGENGSYTFVTDETQTGTLKVSADDVLDIVTENEQEFTGTIEFSISVD